MAGGVEEGPEGRRRMLSTFRDRDEAVYFFILFIAMLAAGIVMTIRGWMALGAVLMACATLSILAVILRPSRAALEGKGAVRRVDEGDSRVEEEGYGAEEAVVSRPPVDGTPAPTSTKRDVPAPPPEPPPMEDVLVDLEGDVDAEAAPTDEEGDGDVWV